MCTSLAFTGSHPCFGRNLDLEESFGEQIVITPRSFPLTFRRLPCQKNHYAIIGMAHVAGGVPLYAEAVNEKGLYMAGLNFPGNACYFPHADDGATEAAPYELIPWLLGQCATIEETKDLLERLRLLDEPFAPGLPSAPLHWHLSDGHTSLVLESMADGLHIHTDPVGVLTNNPPFDFHLTNLRQYLNLTAASPENRFHSALSLSPFGQGKGPPGGGVQRNPSLRLRAKGGLIWLVIRNTMGCINGKRRTTFCAPISTRTLRRSTRRWGG